MAYIFASGIIGAGLTGVLAASSLASAAVQAPVTATASVTVAIDGLRDAKGVVRMCMTDASGSFPKCMKSKSMIATIDAAKGRVSYTFHGVPHGTYAVAAYHDANGNKKMDKLMGIPREGFAFSRNPPIKPRPPRFTEAHFKISHDVTQQMKMRYIL